MDIKVNVTVELGAATLAVLTGLTGGTAKTGAAAAAKMDVVKEETVKDTAANKPAAGATKPAANKAPVKPAAPAFEDLDEAGQLEAIQTHVTRHVKKGKSADIKTLLGYYGAKKASELDASVYPAFHEAIEAYGKGTAVEDLQPEGEDLA